MVKRLSNTDQDSNKLTNVPTPLNANDAANKEYVDSQTSSIIYSEITSAEITAGTASTARAISGRRAQEIVNKAVAAAPVVTVNANAPTSPKIGDIWVEV